MENWSGRTIKGYELAERIGAGGFGAVYKASQATVGREVAMKIILPGFANRPDFIRRFETEAQLIARLEHLHITPLYDYWRDPDGAYLVMRWMRGGSLRERLEDGAYTLESTAALLDQIASALATAHRNNVIHRDIKPGNILLDEDGNAYLADFGIAKDLNRVEGNLTEASAIVGSLDYLSPEQARSEPVTPCTDIYSLGVLLYEIITGRHPFYNCSSVERLYKHINDPLPRIDNLDPTVSDAINDVIQLATQKNPSDRFDNALEMAAAFRRSIQVDKSVIRQNVVEQLTPREQDILRLLVEGRTNKEIADELFIALTTVKWYNQQLFQKLGVRSRVQAVAKARDLKLLHRMAKPIDGATLSDSDLSSGAFSYLPEPGNPYKGLHAFQTADRLDFFGRDNLIEKLLARLKEKAVSSRFLGVIGPSGSGKSSVVRAGLIPALMDGSLPGSDKWFTVEMLPGTHPLDKLEIALTKVAASYSSNLHDHLTRDANGLVRVADLILPEDDSRLVIVVDQFEEVFTLVNNELERQHFLTLLHAAATDARSRVCIIITLRADFYDKPLHYPDFGELLRSHMETILPLSPAEMQQAMIRPAERVNVWFEDGLVAQIVSEMTYQPGVLPLLQYALTELFERRDGRLLTHAAYKEIGGAVGALAQRAESVYKELDQTGRDLTRQMFLRLVTLGEGTEDTRRRVPRSELTAITDKAGLTDDLIDTFAGYRLLSLDNDPTTRTPTVEVAHEAMLREWERLCKWLNDSRADIQLQRQLTQMANDWYEHQNDVSYVLHGSRLEQFEKWAAESRMALTAREREFLDASIQARTAQEAATQAQKIREAGLEKRARVVLRLLVIVFGVAALIGVGLSAFAFDREQAAQNALVRVEREAAVNHSLVLANNAVQNFTSGRTELALILAMQAVQIPDPPSEAEYALRTVALGPGSRAKLTGPTSAVQAVAFSPDSHLAISGSCGELADDGTTCLAGEIIVWDLATHQEMKRFRGHNGVVTSAVFSLDGQTLWSTSSDGTLILWDSDPASDSFGTVVQTFAPGQGGIKAMVLAQDGKTLFVGTDTGLILAVDAAAGSVIRRFTGHTSAVTTIAISPDGQQIVSGSDDDFVILWNTVTGEIVQRFEGHTNTITQVAFNPTGNNILSSSTDFSLRMWDIAEGTQARILSNPTTMNGFAIHPEGHIAMVDYGGGAIVLLDLDQWQLTQYLFNNPVDTDSSSNLTVTAFVYNTSGSLSLTGSVGGSVTLWNMGQSRKLFQFTPLGVPPSFTTMAVRPDDRRMLVGSVETGEALIWDVDPSSPTYRTVLTRLSGYQGMGMITISQYSPDGRTVLIGSADWWGNNLAAKALMLWNVDESSPAFGTILYKFEGFTYFPRSIAFTPDGSKLLLGTQDLEGHGELVLWDATTGELIRHIDTSRDISAILFHPDGKRALTASAFFRDLVEWDIDPASPTFGSETRRLTTSGFTYDLIWGTEGETFLLAEQDANVSERDFETGNTIREFHGANAWKLDISPDRHYLISGHDAGLIIVSDYQTGTELWRQEKQESFIPFVHFSADSQTAFSLAITGVPVQWQVTSPSLDELLQWIPENRYIRDFTAAECDQYRIAPCDSSADTTGME